MTRPASQPFAHSATVAATLIVGEQRIPLAKVSPTAVVFARGSSFEFEPGPATVELTIDGKIRNLNVRVVAPVVPFDDEAVIRQV